LLVLVVGVVVGVNAASDPLMSVAGVAPFALAIVAARLLAPGDRSIRALWSGVATLVVTAVTWAITALAMSALSVGPEPGLNTTTAAIGHKNIENFTLWWKSIATIGNGDYFGRALSPATVLAFLCAVISIAAVVSIPWLAWRQLRRRSATADAGMNADAGTTAFYVFWCSSAILLTLAFLFSAYPVDIHSDRYLLGLLYAASAVVPAAAVGRVRMGAVVLACACVFALSAVVAIADRGPVPAPGQFPGYDQRGRPDPANRRSRARFGRLCRLLGRRAGHVGHGIQRRGQPGLGVRPAPAPMPLRSALHQQLVHPSPAHRKLPADRSCARQRVDAHA
jgi:hypothetical protein